MKQNIIHIGLDVDDKQYHDSVFDKTTGEIVDFKCRPTLKGSLDQLTKLHKWFPRRYFNLCYNASYIGFSLHRDSEKHRIHCEVVAPTCIPKPRSKQIKKDRIDAAQLA